jgi:hypothetical protein
MTGEEVVSNPPEPLAFALIAASRLAGIGSPALI